MIPDFVNSSLTTFVWRKSWKFAFESCSSTENTVWPNSPNWSLSRGCGSSGSSNSNTDGWKARPHRHPLPNSCQLQVHMPLKHFFNLLWSGFYNTGKIQLTIIRVTLDTEFDSVDIWRRPDQMASPWTPLLCTPLSTCKWKGSYVELFFIYAFPWRSNGCFPNVFKRRR